MPLFVPFTPEIWTDGIELMIMIIATFGRSSPEMLLLVLTSLVSLLFAGLSCVSFVNNDSNCINPTLHKWALVLEVIALYPLSSPPGSHQPKFVVE